MNTLTAFPKIESILPQKSPMVLLDQVLAYSEEERGLTAEVLITEKSMFFDPETGHVPVWVGLEYMAQAIAAYSNLSKGISGGEVKIGFLLGTRNFHSHTFGFPLKQSLQIKVKQLYYDGNLGAFECSIKEQDNILAEAQVNVFQPDSVEELLQEYDK
jgi:predicted hotdog family 3-hydroxylacyl-ACP dehydratase